MLVRPGELLWVDVFVPAGDPLWTDDVGRAFRWLGAVWTSALRALGVDRALARRARCTRRGGRASCASQASGPGEVLVGDRKVVGISQRRTRAGARFHCAALRRVGRGRAARGAGVAGRRPRVPRRPSCAPSPPGLDVDLDALEAALLVTELAGAATRDRLPPLADGPPPAVRSLSTSASASSSGSRSPTTDASRWSASAGLRASTGPWR